MKLFDIVPDRFFSILSSAKKELYIEAILLLRETARSSDLVVRRTYLHSLLSDRLGPLLASDDFSEEENEYGVGDDVSSKVSIILRRLMECGWIQTEYASSSSFEENIIIPDYAVTIMDAIYAVMNESRQEYNGFVFSTYAVLKQSENDHDFRYTALDESYRHTSEFIESLKTLYNNIRRYMQRVSALGVNELLSDHFDNYAHDILKKVLDPIKRTDSVYRFKQPILSILESWSDSDEIISSLAAEERKRYPESDDTAAKEAVLRRINFVIDTYSSVQHTISMIENRHAEYTRAAIDRMRYMVSYDRGIRGLLTKILMHNDSNKTLSAMSDSITAITSRFLSFESLYDRVRRSDADDGEMEMVERTEISDNEAESLIVAFESTYSNDKIDDFIMSRLEGKEEVYTTDLGIENEEDSLLFILALMRSSELFSPFDMTIGKDEIESGGFILPNAVFRRKHD